MAVTAEKLKRQRERRENEERLTTPSHQSAYHFSEHRKIEGLYETVRDENFLSSDSLYKQDSRFGVIQMGYDPKRGQSFILTRIKTSIYDHAPSRYQREMSDISRFRELKTGNQNVSFVAKRLPNAPIVVYKAENKRWTENSLRPYLFRRNYEALEKTMPFLTAERDRGERRRLTQRRAELSKAEAFVSGEQRAESRALRLVNEQEIESTDSSIYRKNSLSRNFFRRVNMVFDQQKNELFRYYRDYRTKSAEGSEQTSAEPETDNDDEKKQ